MIPVPEQLDVQYFGVRPWTGISCPFPFWTWALVWILGSSHPQFASSGVANGGSGGEVGEEPIRSYHTKEHVSVGKEFIEDLRPNK